MDWILDFYNFRVVAQYLPEFGRGILSTMGISLVALVLSLVLGTISAIMSLSGRAVLRNISAAYIAAIRSTPLLVQIYLIYFALPALPLLDRRLTELDARSLQGLQAGRCLHVVLPAARNGV
ncbi:MAG: ABC transporter permease subunit, partial [Acidiferrobacterales bacterium]